eukprot:jgi/Mesen1/1284/ME000013S00769
MDWGRPGKAASDSKSSGPSAAAMRMATKRKAGEMNAPLMASGLAVRPVWLTVSATERYLLLEDKDTGDVLLPLIYMKGMFEANYSRKLSSLKHRLVTLPDSLDIDKPRGFVYWQWAFESPHEVKVLVRKMLGEENTPQGHLRLILLPIVFNAMAHKAKCRESPFFRELYQVMRKSTYWPLLKQFPDDDLPFASGAAPSSSLAAAGLPPLTGARPSTSTSSSQRQQQQSCLLALPKVEVQPWSPAPTSRASSADEEGSAAAAGAAAGGAAPAKSGGTPWDNWRMWQQQGGGPQQQQQEGATLDLMGNSRRCEERAAAAQADGERKALLGGGSGGGCGAEEEDAALLFSGPFDMRRTVAKYCLTCEGGQEVDTRSTSGAAAGPSQPGQAQASPEEPVVDEFTNLRQQGDELLEVVKRLRVDYKEKLQAVFAEIHSIKSSLSELLGAGPFDMRRTVAKYCLTCEGGQEVDTRSTSGAAAGPSQPGQAQASPEEPVVDEFTNLRQQGDELLEVVKRLRVDYKEKLQAVFAEIHSIKSSLSELLGAFSSKRGAGPSASSSASHFHGLPAAAPPAAASAAHATALPARAPFLTSEADALRYLRSEARQPAVVMTDPLLSHEQQQQQQPHMHRQQAQHLYAQAQEQAWSQSQSHQTLPFRKTQGTLSLLPGCQPEEPFGPPQSYREAPVNEGALQALQLLPPASGHTSTTQVQDLGSLLNSRNSSQATWSGPSFGSGLSLQETLVRAHQQKLFQEALSQDQGQGRGAEASLFMQLANTQASALQQFADFVKDRYK